MMLMMRTRVRSSSEACVCSLVAPHVGEFLINSFLSWNHRFSKFFSRWCRLHRILCIVPQRQYHHHRSQERSTQLLLRLFLLLTLSYSDIRTPMPLIANQGSRSPALLPLFLSMPWLGSPLTSPPPPGLRHLNQPFLVIRLPQSRRLSNGKPFSPPLHLL